MSNHTLNPSRVENVTTNETSSKTKVKSMNSIFLLSIFKIHVHTQRQGKGTFYDRIDNYYKNDCGI